MKTELKKAVDTVVSATSRDEALKALAAGSKALQKAASKGVIPKNRASRTISRIAKKLNDKFATA
jgi:small subunit ribosomal protein S20